MNARDKVILSKITKYIQDVFAYTSGMDFQQFMADAKTTAATAFAIGQMGELANSISDELRMAHADIPWKGLRGMRNKIIHDYENVDFTMLWQTIIEDLPNLHEQLQRLLQSQ